MKILLVEDEALARVATEKFLRQAGYEVVSAAGPEDAYSLADKCEPEVLICDWELQAAQDGIDVARKLQRRSGTPVIFVTGQSLEDLRQASQDLTVIGYFRKPVSLSQLTAHLAALPPGR